MRSVRVLRNVVTNYLRFLIGGLLGLVITPVMVHLMGDGDYGLWVTVFSLTGYFGLFDQGIRPSLVRYVSRDHTRGDMDGLARTLNSAIALYTTVGVVTLIASVVVAGNFGLWFKLPPARLDEARQLVVLAGASIALGFPLGVFGATLSGLQRYDVANAIGIGISVLRALAFVVVLRLGWGLIGLAWASLAMNLLGHALSWIFVRRMLPNVPYGRRYVTGAHLRLIGSYSSIAFLGALASSIAFQSDALVITAFLGAAAVTPFALAAGLVENVRTLVHSATWVLSPTASELETRGETSKLHQMMIAGASYSVLLSWPPLFALIIFGRNLLTTWIDAEHASAAVLLTILAVPTLLSLIQSVTSSILFGISRHKGVVAISLLNAVINLGLSLLWVRPYGLVGVALGTAVPLALLGGIVTGWYGCRELQLPLGRYLREGLLRPGLVSLVFIAPALALQHFFHPIGWIPLGLTVGGCWLLYAVFAWRFGMTFMERDRWSQALPGLFGNRGAAAASASR